MVSHAVEAVQAFQILLQEMLDKANVVKRTQNLEPALARSDLLDILKRVDSVDYLARPAEGIKSYRYAVIETAVRAVFNELLATLGIEQPEFVRMWNLLDTVSLLSDDELCDPALGFWLVEELLDSQTIAGCGKVFDYLESRRERMTSKHFKQKELVILRSCKELLRRLSRAEDTAFCGRVYVFMFQSFPLGDKSSVNLRGEYHVENVTTFDELRLKTEGAEETMEVDNETTTTQTAGSAASNVGALSSSISLKSSEESKGITKSVSFDAKANQADKPLDPDVLYPIFWVLQQSFSQPKRLFDQGNLVDFKKGLEATMVMFKSIHKSVQNDQRSPSKSLEDSRRGSKRKRGQSGHDLATTFNPKYLTSRDLFELELSDLSFRRHILVQALIIMDFLLSLGPKAKEKLATIKVQNKSVMYQEQTLREEDTKWAMDTKKAIADYLRQGAEGPFFTRMVETVISRDKNWVRWKVESCPTIEKPAITPEAQIAARDAARKTTANKRLRSKPLGSLDLGFLSDFHGGKAIERLKDPSRYRVPSLDSFKNRIALDDMEIDMPTSDETKEAAINGKASKSWRALRIASKTKLAAFDKIEDPEKIDVIFQDDAPEVENVKEGGEDQIEAEESLFLSDRRPMIISGPSGVGKGTLITTLIRKHPKVFGKTASHTVRVPHEGEIDGTHYFFTDQEKFNMMRDSDQFLEVNTFNGSEYGTSRKIVEGIIANGKVPVMEMDFHGIQQLKDQNYPARYIFLVAPSMEELKRRLHSGSQDSEEKIKKRLEIAKDEMRHSEIDGFYDKIIVNDDLSTAFEELERYVYLREDPDEMNFVEDTEPAGEETMKVKTSRLETVGITGTG